MSYVYENDQLVICGECREPKQYLKIGKGKSAHRVEVCACAMPPLPEKQGRKKCSPRNAKAKGDGLEREVVKLAEGAGCKAFRTAGSGAHGSRNGDLAYATDVRIQLGDTTIKVECKRHASIGGLKTLHKLRDGSDWLWMREDFAEPWVLMSGEMAGYLLSLAAEAVKK